MDHGKVEKVYVVSLGLLVVRCMWDLLVDTGANIWAFDAEVTHSLVIGLCVQAMKVLPLEHVMLLVEQVSVEAMVLVDLF